MPRGVYDRSKMKNPAKKSDTAAPAPKRAYKRKTAVGASGEKSGPSDELSKVAVPMEQGKAEMIGGRSSNHRDIYNIRENLNVLTNTRASVIGPIGDPYTTLPITGSTRGILITKLDTLITKIVDQLDEALFPVEKAVAVEAVDEVPEPKASAPKTNGAAVTPAPVAVAPVPFNPPAFTQPQS